jgi:hypothetical protein
MFSGSHRLATLRAFLVFLADEIVGRAAWGVRRAGQGLIGLGALLITFVLATLLRPTGERPVAIGASMHGVGLWAAGSSCMKAWGESSCNANAAARGAIFGRMTHAGFKFECIHFENA